MRARLFGRWVGRAAVFAALGFGALVAGGIASAATSVDQPKVESAGPAVSEAISHVVALSYSWDWN